MRFLGNKESIAGRIRDLLDSRGLLGRGLSFFDAFCGSGSVSDALKDAFRLVVNDIMTWSVLFTRGRIKSYDCTFELLGLDPFTHLNGNKTTKHGFFYKNYSPGGSHRMYFTKENAGRIDYFRWQIEDWRHRALIDEDEYAVLLASLIESVSSVSNTAGVYGAFLKKWDARALKPIMFRKVGALMLPSLGIEQRCGKIEDVIEDVPCDILYIDPPYTQNQYGTQYHIFETLVLADQPKISRITGSRSTAPYRSDWSKEYKAHILLDKIVAKTKARYVVMSYSNDGILSKDYIEAVLKRYGKPDTLVCEKIEYKQYLNWKAKEDERHFEYLFFVEKKPVNEVVYEAPLNYVGSKAKMMSDIRANLPENIDTLMDVFGGGRIKVIPTDMTMEIAHFNESDSLRSPQYMYNLLALRGMKKCSLCSCDVPEIIQGAHIWGVSQIKHIPGFSLDKKLEYALDGENGLWLCENHHKMFDANVISFNAEGKVLLRNNLMQSQKEFIEWATPTMQLPAELISDGFKFYISKRYAS